jgi:hypothetical protein
MAALSPGASLPLNIFTVVWLFLLWPDRRRVMWGLIFVVRAGLPWGWDPDARMSDLWMECCLEAASTTKRGGFLGIEPQSISKIDTLRVAMGPS